MNKRPILIDTDPGIDDAIAIAAALMDETLDVKLFTTVAGNVSLEKVTYNLLRLLTFLGKPIPVAKGADRPLVRDLINAADVHGESGIDGYDFPEPDKSLLLDCHAVEAMRRVILDNPEPITLVPIAPLTNIALLLRMYPEVGENIAEIVLMGGSTGRGNHGVLSEFNIAADPEAAKIVFDSGLPIVMVGLDVASKSLVLPEDFTKLLSIGKAGEMTHALLKSYRGGDIKSGLKMFDSAAIAYLLRPDLFEVVETMVDVELSGTLTAGATVVDLKGYLNRPANAKVCVGIDSEAFRTWFIEALTE